MLLTATVGGRISLVAYVRRLCEEMEALSIVNRCLWRNGSRLAAIVLAGWLLLIKLALVNEIVTLSLLITAIREGPHLKEQCFLLSVRIHL